MAGNFDLDPVFLISAILVVVGSIAYVFFWNTIIGTLLSFVLRVAYWNQGGSSIWVSIGSIHFSLVAGRILFKDFRYYSSNQAIRIVKGKLQWRYWIRAPMDDIDFRTHGHGKGKRTECRIHAALDGFDWAIYNRTPTFDYIVSQMEARNPPITRSASRARSGSLDGAASVLRQVFGKVSASEESGGIHLRPTARFFTVPRVLTRAMDYLKSQLPDLDFKSLLPLSFAVKTGVITCGNVSTPSLLVAEFSSADGSFGNVPSQSPYDLYKQVLNVKFEKASLNFVENEAYDESMAATGERLFDELTTNHFLATETLHPGTYRSFAKLWRAAKLGHFVSYLRDRGRGRGRGRHSDRHRGKRRTQSMDVDTPIGINFARYEYARERTILEAPVLTLSYYVDVVGPAPSCPAPSTGGNLELGNGGDPPEWGIDFMIQGGSVRYGPWADRQRAELQRAFFPASYADTEPTERLQPGMSRVWTALRVFVELRDGTTLYVPFREPSKDWMWDGQYNGPRPRRREPASLIIKAGDDSTISYFMPTVTDEEGYRPLLEVHLDSVTVSSSLNDIRLLRAESCRIQGNLHSPLRWNAHRTWQFNISLRQSVLYLLRDHINMFTDLGNDWTTGPPSNYNTWVPITYGVDVDMQKYEINTYVNDHNIIDKPLLREENALLAVCGGTLRFRSVIPANKFRPLCSTFSFEVSAPDVAVSMSLPRWTSHRLVNSKPVTKLGRIGHLGLEGSYLWHADRRPDNIEQLKLHFTATKVIFMCLGWSIRYFMIFQENYFGSFTHFSTIHEYLDRRKTGRPVGDPVLEKHRPGSSNMLQVELDVTLDKGIVILPAGLLGYRNSDETHGNVDSEADLGDCTVFSLSELQVGLMIHDFGMQFSVNVGPIRGNVCKSINEREIYDAPPWKPSSECLSIDGLNISANVLYGPQPFAASYVWMWELQFGDMKATLTLSEARLIGDAISSFGANFKDPFNAPAAEFAIPSRPDANWYKVSLSSVDVISTEGDVAFQVLLPTGLRLDTNDLAGDTYRRVTSLRIPGASLRVMRHCVARDCWVEAGELGLEVTLEMYSAPVGWQETAKRQAEFIAKEDARTGRLLGIAKTQARKWTPAPMRAVYTIPLRLPRPHEALKKPRRGSQLAAFLGAEPASEPGKPAPFAQRQLSYMSDSDGEDRMNDSERDLRLANSRPPSVLLRSVVVDENFSSGDESDDDLTDDGSDSYWSEVDEEQRPLDALTRRYALVSRHFTAQVSSSPSQWWDSAFAVQKDRLPVHIPLPHPNDRVSGWTVLEDWRAKSFGESFGSTMIRLKIGSIEAWFNPLLPSALKEFMEKGLSPPISPQARIESYLLRHIDAMNSKLSADPKNTTVVDLSVSSVRLRCIQFAPAPKSREKLATPPPHNLPTGDALTALDFHISGVRMKLQIMNGVADSSPSLAVVVDDVGLGLGAGKMTARQHGAGYTFTTVLSLSLGHFTVMNEARGLGISWNVLSVALDHSACGHLLDAAVPYVGPSIEAATTHSRLSKLDERIAQQQIYFILKWSSQNAVVDPLSTMQPSYLIQSGRPHELRVSPMSKLIVSLRNCLREMPMADRKAMDALSVDDEPVPQAEIVAMLDSQLSAMNIDAEDGDITAADWLRTVLPSWRSRAQKKGKDTGDLPLEYLTFTCRSSRLTIADPKGGSPCHLASAGLGVTVCFKPMELQPLRGNAKPVMYRHALISVVIEGVDVLVLPHLLYLIQTLLSLRPRIQRLGSSLPPRLSSSVIAGSPGISSLSTQSLYGDFNFSLGQMRVQVAEEKLVLVYNISRFMFLASALQRRSQSTPSKVDQSVNSSLMFSTVSLAAHSVKTRGVVRPRDILAEFVIQHSVSNIVAKQEGSLRIVRGAVNLGSLRFSVPRSAIRLIKFIEGWREDYLPPFEQTMQAIIVEIRKSSLPPSRPCTPCTTPAHSVPQPRNPTPSFNIHVNAPEIGVSLHIMPGTWLSWEVFDTIYYTRFGSASSPVQSNSLGLRVLSQRISVTSTESQRPESPTARKLKLDLPSITISGYRGHGPGVHLLASIGFFQTTVKPKHWDTLLAVQQKFGQDFDDLVHVLADVRRRRQPTLSKPVEKPRKSLLDEVGAASVKLRGFRIGLEGRSSTMLFECQDINGSYGYNGFLSGGRHVNLTVLGLGLSLAPRTAVSKKSQPSTRNQRSAFLIVDFTARMTNKATNENELKEMRFVVERMHGVLQPSSIGELGDFVDHLQASAEVLARQEERARALSEFKEKTKEVMRSFDIRRKESKKEASYNGFATLFADYSIMFKIKNIGAAFPLALDKNLQMQRPQHPERPQRSRSDFHAHVRAFLFSIKSLDFGVESYGSKGLFTMKSFSFQFVDRFRQSYSADFSGDNHITRNRLVYPDMTAQIHTEMSGNVRVMNIQAVVSGFILDLDASIADYVFSLVDVYRHGKERVEKLTVNNPRAHPPSPNVKPRADPLASESQYNTVPTSNIVLHLTFQSGTLRMHSGMPGRSMSTNNSIDVRPAAALSQPTIETFFLPVLTVWGEYRATPAAQKLPGSKIAQPSTLIFKATVHSSENTLRPSLLPFVTDLIKIIEDRLRKVTKRPRLPTTPVRPAALTRDISAVTSDLASDDSPVSSIQITFALRIDQSKLQLTCQPDVNVVAGVHWDSGGFVINISPGANQVSFMANVSGLTVGLKHGFLSEDCVRLDARNLAFSTTFSHIEQGDGKRLSYVSVTVDTGVAGGVRFSRLQDVLCFKAVWLDRIPIFATSGTVPQTPQEPLAKAKPPPSPAPSASVATGQELVTVVLVRLHSIEIDVDLGQSITNVRMDMHNAIFRTRLEELGNSVSLDIGDLTVTASGNISGKARIPDFAFRTIRRKHMERQSHATNMLELQLTSGIMELVLESDYQKILHLWQVAQPLRVHVTDDWSQMSPSIPLLERLLRLSFNVSGQDVVLVATVTTIPKLFQYAKKFQANLKAQREGATRESKAFRLANAPKPENPLSAVANAMLQSARTKLRETEDSLSHVIEQQMDFSLGSLRLVVFPRSMTDFEMAYFAAREVGAQLVRVEAADRPARRRLHLSFASMSTSRVGQLNHTAATAGGTSNVAQWFAALRKGASDATIFDLPAMDMSMASEERVRRVLEYDFHSKFIRGAGGGGKGKDQEDIFITLNMSLYSWLQVLRKNLSREMEQVRAAEWRSTASSILPSAGNLGTTRKRGATLVDATPPSDGAFFNSATPPLGTRTPGRLALSPPPPLSGTPPLNPAPKEHRRMFSLASLTWKNEPPKAVQATQSAQGAQGIEGADEAAPCPPPLDVTPSVLGPPIELAHSPAPVTSAPSTASSNPSPVAGGFQYRPRERTIERLNMRQLGEATPDVMHPFFMKKAGFNLEDALPQYVHEYAAVPIEQIMQVLLKLYSKQLGDEAQETGDVAIDRMGLD
ncbi:hypothetical protein K488DRAFT_82999 [Vararia minispora EC-137]|uniref:Uncharacterized protein n=1 Tax=Vararia minispora EC-137 TaxID=1314806 RepID=A0ACB8QW49_9AGAM|nr:hypothetical protein K488DRAFT_82999 [Vararia minispora EC-137]